MNRHFTQWHFQHAGYEFEITNPSCAVKRLSMVKCNSGLLFLSVFSHNEDENSLTFYYFLLDNIQVPAFWSVWIKYEINHLLMPKLNQMNPAEHRLLFKYWPF